MSAVIASTPTEPLNVANIRRDFPILSREIHGKPLIYLDNAASAQRPAAMIDATADYYSKHNANIHRGVHTLAEEATELYEAARVSMAELINAPSDRNVVFVRGVTEGVNMVSQAFVRPRVKAGDQILITHMEHHSNIVPWQLLAKQTGVELKVIPINDRGELDMEAFAGMLNERVKMLGVVHVSNALGTINPVAEMVRAAKAMDIPVLVDGAQAMPHLPVDVQELDCDFYCVSGHKMYGPTGAGVLYGKSERLQEMEPYHGGGEMIKHVTFEESLFNEAPAKFEAGTPNIAGGIGLGASARYLMDIGMPRIRAYESELLAYATDAVSQVEGLRIIGTAANKSSVVSFTLEGIHPHDLGTILDHAGVAIRTGHHCAMPVMQFFQVPATSRMSLAMYNTREEVDQFVKALSRARDILS
ncbi:MAG: aminotransferase class V-fold PLP-dependent enzyme [Lysobacterales bacterium]